MYKITADPKVLEALKTAFPKPPKAAEKALNKYVSLLEDQINKSEDLGRSEIFKKKEWFVVSKNLMQHRGGQIGKNKIRLHKWLVENKLELFKDVMTGSNLAKRLSVVKLSELAKLESDQATAVNVEDAPEETQADILRKYMPGLLECDPDEVDSKYDLVPVDEKSLNYFVHWLSNDADFISKAKKDKMLHDANRILKVSSVLKSMYVQERKPSIFGRTYYHGISVQNINKMLRQAMLGDCYEYDVRGSAYAWKMSFSRECHHFLKTDQSYERTFYATRSYLLEKPIFIKQVMNATFKDPDHELSEDAQRDMIKEAINAIGFGARRGTTGWRVGAENKNPAIVEIIKNPQDRERFMNYSLIRDLISEQNLLSKFIVNTAKEKDSYFLKLDEVKTVSGKLSTSKLLACMYQHAETKMMNTIDDFLRERGYDVIARVHDAIFLRRHLRHDDYFDLCNAVKEEFCNEYFGLKQTKLEAFQRPASLDREELEQHRQRIREETERAKNYLSQRSNTLLVALTPNASHQNSKIF